MVDYYVENGYTVFTAEYLKRRNKCCGSGCRHCPYITDDKAEFCHNNNTKPVLQGEHNVREIPSVTQASNIQ